MNRGNGGATRKGPNIGESGECRLVDHAGLQSGLRIWHGPRAARTKKVSTDCRNYTDRHPQPYSSAKMKYAATVAMTREMSMAVIGSVTQRLVRSMDASGAALVASE